VPNRKGPRKKSMARGGEERTIGTSNDKKKRKKKGSRSSRGKNVGKGDTNQVDGPVKPGGGGRDLPG